MFSRYSIIAPLAAAALAIGALASPALVVADELTASDGIVLLNAPGDGAGLLGGESLKGSNQASVSQQTPSLTTGLVLIDTEINYGQAAAAGTGMVLTAGGIVITNHHVVAGSTSISVTDPSTGNQYQADVLGYDTTDDVAVLQLEGATNMATVTMSTQVGKVGDAITAVGNAEGQGQLVEAAGRILGTDVSITVSEEDGSGQANLTGLFQTTAALVPGDSGGAMFDNSSKVVAMNVAGSTSQRNPEGYGIPVVTVLKVANAVLTGQANSTITLGRTAALGISILSTQAAGAPQIIEVIPGAAADQAGIRVGSTLTSLDGITLTSPDQIKPILATHQPGDKVQATWTDRSGRQHTATVTLGVAPLA